MLWKHQPKPVCFLQATGSFCVCVCVCVCGGPSKLGERSGMWQQAQIFTSLSELGPVSTQNQSSYEAHRNLYPSIHSENWLKVELATLMGYLQGIGPRQSSLRHEFIVVFFIHSWPEGRHGAPDGLRAATVAHMATGDTIIGGVEYVLVQSNMSSALVLPNAFSHFTDPCCQP